MTGPDMDTITASLERSLQNFSLNNHPHSSSSSNTTGAGGAALGVGCGGGISRTSSSDLQHHDDQHQQQQHQDDLTNTTTSAEAAPTLELNSHISLPDHWEQCLDLKSGEIYYINWRTGMKTKEHPRMMKTASEWSAGEFYSEEDESSYDSEGSSTESSPSASREKYHRHHHHNHHHHHHHHHHRNNIDNTMNVVNVDQSNEKEQPVLVVAGCKSCLMYFMVPKRVEDCPKCCGQLLHFDK